MEIDLYVQDTKSPVFLPVFGTNNSVLLVQIFILLVQEIVYPPTQSHPSPSCHPFSLPFSSSTPLLLSLWFHPHHTSLCIYLHCIQLFCHANQLGHIHRHCIHYILLKQIDLYVQDTKDRSDNMLPSIFGVRCGEHRQLPTLSYRLVESL